MDATKPTFIDLKQFFYYKIILRQHWWHPILLCKDLEIKTGSYIDYYTEETLPFIVCNTKKAYGSLFCTLGF